MRFNTVIKTGPSFRQSTCTLKAPAPTGPDPARDDVDASKTSWRLFGTFHYDPGGFFWEFPAVLSNLHHPLCYHVAVVVVVVVVVIVVVVVVVVVVVPWDVHLHHKVAVFRRQWRELVVLTFHGQSAPLNSTTSFRCLCNIHVAGDSKVRWPILSMTGSRAKKKETSSTHAGMLLMASSCCLLGPCSICGIEKWSYQKKRGSDRSLDAGKAFMLGWLISDTLSGGMLCEFFMTDLKASWKTLICLPDGSGWPAPAHWCEINAAWPIFLWNSTNTSLAFSCSWGSILFISNSFPRGTVYIGNSMGTPSSSWTCHRSIGTYGFKTDPRVIPKVPPLGPKASVHFRSVFPISCLHGFANLICVSLKEWVQHLANLCSKMFKVKTLRCAGSPWKTFSSAGCPASLGLSAPQCQSVTSCWGRRPSKLLLSERVSTCCHPTSVSSLHFCHGPVLSFRSSFLFLVVSFLWFPFLTAAIP